MVLKQRVVRLFKKASSYPKKYTVPGAVLGLLFILYGLIFFIEKPVLFSYAEPTCTKYFTLFPSMYHASASGYAVEPADYVRIGDFALAARSLCFTPTEPPQEGESKIGYSLGGSLFMRKTFALSVAAPPSAHVAVLDQPVPLSRPLTLPLSATDKIYDYRMRVDDRQTDCSPAEKAVSCAVNTLNLAQGKPYTVEFVRHFDGKNTNTVVKKAIKTLSATKVVKSSVKKGETIYSKPKSFSFTFDKKIVRAKLALYVIRGEKKAAIDITSEVKNGVLELAVKKDLPRSSDYVITIESVEAADGSGLDGEYRMPFKTSGGPKVTGVNVGSTGIAMGTTVVITFDQPLSKKQNISRLVAATGGAAVAGKSGNQLRVSLAGVKKCGDFSIKISEGLESNYDIVSKYAWNFSGRTVCHTARTFGYSHQGRPLTAYYFGSGPSVIMYTGAIHGSEGNTRNLMLQWVDYLEANARRIPSGKAVVVVPTINPDGIAMGSRTNARNVDLNRNFATNDWKKDITTVNNTPFKGGGGKSAMSEPETKAIAGLASQLQPRLILSFHSVGGVVAANQAGISGSRAAQYASLTGYGNVTGNSDSTFEYSVTGTADDWYAQKLGVASILIELSSSYTSQFEMNRNAMWAMLN